MTSVRRSQAERSAATRATLLDATIDCLIEEGYASITTSRVAERAGLSRGAHLHHFQTRNALVAAAVEQLAERWLAELRTLPPSSRRTPGARWPASTCCGRTTPRRSTRPRWTSGPTPATTRTCASAWSRSSGCWTARRSSSPTACSPPRADMRELVQLSVATVRGLAMLDTLHPDGARSREQWAFIRPRLAELFEAA